MRVRVTSFVLGLFLAASAPAAAGDPPQVVASIKPVHSLVAAVMKGVATPSLVVGDAGSPHGFSLRPSQASELTHADAVFWIGPQLETFLARPLDALAGKVRSVRLDEADGLKILDLRAGGSIEDDDHDGDGDGHAGEHGHDHNHDHDHDHDHDHGRDMHIWLDAGNLRAMARHVVASLSAVDPDNAALYRSNGEALLQRIDTVDRSLAEDLAPIRHRPFVVFHDAYQYFEQRYGLRVAASFTINAETPPGAKRLAAIRARIAQTGASCVFAEPQFRPDILESVAADTGIRTGVLDPLGAAVSPGPQAWEDILTGLARALKACLDAPT